MGLFSAVILVAQDSASDLVLQDSMTVFIGQFGVQVDQDEAIWRREATRLQDDRYVVKDYSTKGDYLHREGTVTYNLAQTMFTLDGAFTYYHPNGAKLMVGTYDDGKEVGEFSRWYPDGQLQEKILYVDEEFDHDYLVVEYCDSLGQQLVANGQGTYHETDDQGHEDYKARGPVLKGLKTGTWQGSFNHASGLITFTENYKKGKLTSGVSSNEEGQSAQYKKVMLNPEYQGGINAYYKFVAKNMVYPKYARRRGIQGTVYVQFVVDRDGSVIDVWVPKGIGEHCDAEAMRVVGMARKFQPGKYRGQSAKVRMVMPIIFKLN